MTRRKIDLVGQKFGNWLVISKCDLRSKHGEVLWHCRCLCGSESNVKGGNLTNGTSKSCGCMKPWSTHGMTGVPTFKSWESMKQRCCNPNAPDYEAYGGRGITVCDRWLNSFDAFLKDMGLRPSGTTLDRIDVNKGYSPENCRWASASTQNRNKRQAVTVNALGKTLTVYEWAEMNALSPRIIIERLRAGWPPEIAVSKPNRKK